MKVRGAISIGDIPSPGALLGTSGSANLIQSINESLGAASFFGSARDAYSTVSNAFIENVVNPIRNMSQEITHLSRKLLNPDAFRALETRDDFTYTPPCMFLPIVMYAPMRKLLEQGRIGGYGFDPENFPDVDPYEHIVESGTINDVLEACGDESACDLTWTWYSDDPELSIDEIDHIYDTRRAIDVILAEDAWDPTDPASERG